MRIFILLFSIVVFSKTLFYGIYEFKNRKNYFGGIIIFLIAIICLIGPNIIMQIR